MFSADGEARQPPAPTQRIHALNEQFIRAAKRSSRTTAPGDARPGAERWLGSRSVSTPNDRVAVPFRRELRARRPSRRTPRCGPAFHLNVRSARLQALRTGEPDDPPTSAGRSLPRPPRRAGLPGTGGHRRRGGHQAGSLYARTAKAWSLMQLERQLRPEASSRSTRRSGNALTSQRRSPRPGTPR
jgi:hypothetical protein